MSKRTDRDYTDKLEEAKSSNKNKRQKLSALPKEDLKGQIPQLLFSPPQEYQNFLKNYLVDKGRSGNRKLTQEDIDKWPYRYDPGSAQSNIINEVAQEFNQSNKFGIGKVNKLAGEYANDMGGYSMSMDLEKPPKGNQMPKGDYSFFTIPNKTSQNYPPDPFTITHELVHANDHQNHNLNSKVWKDLKTLYKALGKDDEVFDNAIIDIQNTIDPTGGFAAGAYTPDEIKRTSLNDINRWRREISKTEELPLQPLPNWQAIFKETKPLLTQQTPFGNPSIDNYHFLLTKGSEFPAHAIQNLHNPWKANETIPNVRKALNEPSKKFLDSMLSHMGNAYLPNNAPVTNDHINRRRNSLGLADILQNPFNQNQTGQQQSDPQQNPLTAQQQNPNLLGQGASQPGNQFSQFGQQAVQQQNPFRTSNSRRPQPELTKDDIRSLLAGGVTEDEILGNQSLQPSSLPREMIQPRGQQNQQPGRRLASGGSVSSNYDPYLNTGSASSGLGSLYDSLRRYAGGGGVGLGDMGRFFGLYPMRD